MLLAEARWFERQLAALDPEQVFPLCNIGSSTGEFRTVVQPFIDAHVFAPPRKRGQRVVHVDIKAAEGVDVVGDLTNAGDAPRLAARLAEAGVRSVFCSNLLEHVEDRAAFCRAILQIVPPGGYIFLSVPYRYPFHPDPIDTMWRPAPDELSLQFPRTDVIAAEVLDCGTLLDNREWLELPKKALWVFLPWYKPRKWRANLSFFGYLRRPFLATCLVLRRRIDVEPVTDRT